MADNRYDWRLLAPKGMHAVIYPRRCGWHILLSQTGPTVESRLRPVIIGKSCVPYKVHEDDAVGQDQATALAIGLANIAENVVEECDNL